MSDIQPKSEDSSTMSDKQDTEENAQRCQKRGRSDDVETNEPLVKKSTFKLQPATLIHGMKKAVPKQTSQSEQNKCKFLQPSRLQPPQSSGRFKLDNSSTSSNVVTSSAGSSDSKVTNPFLICNSTDDEGDPTPKKKKPDQVEETATKKTDTSNLLSGNNKVAEGNNSTFSSLRSSSKDNKPSFVFGQNLSERAKVEEGNEEKEKNELISFSTIEKTPSTGDEQSSSQNEKEKTTTETSTTATVETTTNSKNDESRSKLEENAAEHFAASQTRTIAPAVDVITGEEDEKNVLQIQCKLYQYDQKTQAWKERGVGNLHLNDCNFACNDQFQSRLVMRTNGSMRVVLNTKVWAQMSLDRASKKSIRISAQTQSADIGVYLISGSANDMEQVHRAIEYRVRHQKQVEEYNKQQNGTNNEKKNQQPETGDSSAPSPSKGSEEKTKNSDEKPQTENKLSTSAAADTTTTD